MSFLLAAILAVSVSVKGVPFTPMEYERLPELNIPRQAHSLHYAGGEYVVLGGHTTGFVPTATAEYFRRGKWHTVSTLYPHDAGFSTQLSDGGILVAGGYAEPFGVGQTWGVEVYRPQNHTFTYLPILDRKRAHATVLEMTGGLILVAGNWYGPDFLESSANGEPFQKVKELSQERDLPFVLQVSEDNAYIFGSTDPYGKPLEGGWVDQLSGDPFQESLLQQWTTENLGMPNVPEHYRIGEFCYMLPVSRNGERAFLCLERGNFSLMETSAPIPLEGPWGAISWQDGLSVETASESAWKQGRDADGRFYLLQLHYDSTPATVEVYYSEPIENLPLSAEGLALPGGDFLRTGGVIADAYDAQSMVLLFHTRPVSRGGIDRWWLVLLGLGAVLLAFWGFRRFRRAGSPEYRSAPEKAYPGLLEKIVGLMEEDEIFRNPNLRVGDIAARLNTNSTYVSACINKEKGVSFPRFVSDYRIRYAKEQMRLYPEKKLSVIADESGFASENSFFRSFKAETGCTPAEWREKYTRNNS
ncbi:MAG: helix-turn-helix transcriptional regulator [Bacteroidales bacterium]|nr:helix-turn-helix transcriptional regulator [Bacteroidales bacterium]